MIKITDTIYLDYGDKKITVYETDGKVVKKREGIGKWIYTGDHNNFPRMIKLKSILYKQDFNKK